MNKIGFISIILLLMLPLFRVNAQEQTMAYNPNSVYPVHEENKLYSRQVWRRMDLKEKQNWPFFSASNEITTIILDAVKDGRLTPYENDSLTRRMTKEEFLEKLIIKTGEEDDSWGDDGGDAGDAGDAWGDDAGGADDTWGEARGSAEPSVDYIFGHQLTLLDLKEDVYFDRIRSRMFYDIQAVTIIIPSDWSATGIERPLGTFRFKDLEQLFRSMPNEAIWYNAHNTSQHRNLADAFLLRLFSARVTKVSNPRDQFLVDIYPTAKEALYESQNQEYKMIEFEHDLWEY